MQWRHSNSQLSDLELQFQHPSGPVLIPIAFHALYPIVESALERITCPSREVKPRHIQFKGEALETHLHMHFVALAFQSGFSWYHDESANFEAHAEHEWIRAFQQDCLRLGLEFTWTESEDSRQLTLSIPLKLTHKHRPARVA